MALFVALQSLSAPVQRTAERAHMHIARVVAGTAAQSPAWAAVGHEDFALSRPHQDQHRDHKAKRQDAQHHDLAQAMFRHKRDAVDDQDHEHDAARPHAHTASHEHAANRGDVVYVDAREPGVAAGSTPPTKHPAFDVDALLPRASVAPVVARQQAAATEVLMRFRSHTELPLDRPPRVGA